MYRYRKRKGKMQYLLGGNKKRGFNGTRKRKVGERQGERLEKGKKGEIKERSGKDGERR